MQKYGQYLQLKFCLFLPQKFSMIGNLSSDRENDNNAPLIYLHILIREPYGQTDRPDTQRHTNRQHTPTLTEQSACFVGFSVACKLDRQTGGREREQMDSLVKKPRGD